MPQVSVLMPVYNAEAYLAGAVESILGQTFRDFELVIIDDGSTDGSRSMLERYAQEEHRIRLISRPNTGCARALNEGLSSVDTPLIARMDADDIALPERFALQVAFLEAHPGVACVGGRYETMDERGRPLLALDSLPVDDAEIQGRLLIGDNVIPHPAAMMRREAVLAVGAYDPELTPAEDLDLWLRLGERWQLANVPQIVLRYREHSGSVSSTSHRMQLEVMRSICERAWKRRGVEGRFQNEGWRPTNRREAHQVLVRNGWAGLRRGDRSQALDYALRAIRKQPHRGGGWRLLVACGKRRGATAPAG